MFASPARIDASDGAAELAREPQCAVVGARQPVRMRVEAAPDAVRVYGHIDGFGDRSVGGDPREPTQPLERDP